MVDFVFFGFFGLFLFLGNDRIKNILKLEDVLNKYDRVAIVGAPGTGKTTLASKRSDYVSTGQFAYKGWRMSGIKALESVKHQRRYVVEGVTAVHAVRANPEAFDAVIVMQLPKAERYKDNIATGVHTVLDAVNVPKIYELNCE